MAHNKATNTCNPAVTGFCLFPRIDSLRIQPPLIALGRYGDVSSVLSLGDEKRLYPQANETGKVCKSSSMSLHPICGDIYNQFCIPKRWHREPTLLFVNCKWKLNKR